MPASKINFAQFQFDGAAQLLGRHVVKQHRIDANGERFFELRQCIDLAFYLDEVPDGVSRQFDRRRYAAGNCNVIVLDQDSVVEAETMIGSASCTHRIFLNRSQAGCRFPGADDACLLACNCGNN